MNRVFVGLYRDFLFNKLQFKVWEDNRIVFAIPTFAPNREFHIKPTQINPTWEFLRKHATIKNK